MKVLVIGSGGREHAIAWKISFSPRLTGLFIAPGNPGTAHLGKNVPIPITDHQGLINFAREEGIDLVVIGPETPLAAGLADAFIQEKIKVFGPTQKAARIEASKTFSKDFMARHHIPTARYATFSSFESAKNYINTVDYPIVIKASGLAAGKGVLLPETKQEAVDGIKTIMVDHEFGSAGDEVVIEERLYGQEISLMAFTDGTTVVPMVPAQDHKRLLDNDQGPNTGGMGAYAPAPVCTPELVQEILTSILQPAVNGLKSEGFPFTGVLYAGVILTSNGPSTLEFNCRFGDPETQVVLPLLANDLLDVLEACTNQTLGKLEVKWHPGSAICVVAASAGYPGKLSIGKSITGLESRKRNAVCFHAGTDLVNNTVVTSGGRVLGVVGWADTFEMARNNAYQVLDNIHFEGMQFRRDIGHHALNPTTPAHRSSAYASSGVNIDAGNRAVELMKDAVRSTYTPAVLAGIGAFGGLFDASEIKKMDKPVLVASTDGVGTKVKLAVLTGKYTSIGFDIVNHCINDILVQGAVPLFFLDYIASAQLSPEMVASVVTGISSACKESGVVLLGGETAEMPGVYQPAEFDLAGTIVGVLEKENMLPRPGLQPGDVILGLHSSGPHTNGYSLIRKVFEGTDLNTHFPELGTTLAEALMKPHRSYLPLLKGLLTGYPEVIKALAHLTGGGFIENIPRILPPHLDAVIDTSSWQVPALFGLIQTKGSISKAEMYRVFNMGIGMVAFVGRGNVAKFRSQVKEETWIIGELASGTHKVILK
jgi:phosphoribosylamine--glycine ligase / phosphoribosylformylglycinamidine cyclo-ligase